MCCNPTCSAHARKLLFLLTLSAVFLGFGGCGKKGDPMPRLRDIPLRTDKLTVLQQGNLLVLELPYPSATVSGMPLGGIDTLEVLQMIKPVVGYETGSEEGSEDRAGEGETVSEMPPADEIEEETLAEEPPEEETPEESGDEASAEEEEPEKPRILPVEPAEFEASAEVLLTLHGTELGAALVGSQLQVRIPLAEEIPPQGVTHYFGVRTTKGEETSALSNVVGLIPVPPVAPPQNLKAEARPRSIQLTWESEGDAKGFDIFRREADERGYGNPLRRVTAEDRSFLDTSARYGNRYIYTVRAIASLDPLVLSSEAGEREIDYEDRFAPPLPKSFVALGERSRVRLRWEASNDDDVAGYVLYRREPRREEFHKLGDGLITGTEYIDRGLVTRFSYEYRIQVVDQAGNESDVSEPVQATAR